MQRKILSISVAAYNVEAYLAQTLDSIISCKTLSAIDVIVVNDGSEDGTLAVAQKYAVQYPDSIRVINKQNGGYGSNINASILEAEGAYYRLLDGDDWVDSGELDRLVRFLDEIDSDLIVTKYSSVRRGEVKQVSLNWSYDAEVRPIEKRLDYRYAMHMLTFRTETLRDVLMREPIMEKANYTDFEFNVKGICACKTVVYFDADVYRYRLGREGQSVELASWFRSIDKACGVTLHVAEYYERIIKNSSSIGEELKRWALDQCVGSAKYKCRLVQMMGGDRDTYEHLNTFLGSLKEMSPAVYSSLARRNADLRCAASCYMCFFVLSLPRRFKAFLMNCRGR